MKRNDEDEGDDVTEMRKSCHDDPKKSRQPSAPVRAVKPKARASLSFLAA